MKIQPYRHLPTGRPVWAILLTEGDPKPRHWRMPWIFRRTFPTKGKAELALEVFNAGGKFPDFLEALKTKR